MTRSTERFYRQSERERLDAEAAREVNAAERMAHLMAFCDPEECPLCQGATMGRLEHLMDEDDTGAATAKGGVESSPPNPATGWPTSNEVAAAPSSLVVEELPESQRKRSSGSQVESDDPAVPQPSNPYEAKARAEKAVKLADTFRAVLREQRLKLDRIEPSKLSEEFWRALAQRASVRVPSAETRRMVIRHLEQTRNRGETWHR